MYIFIFIFISISIFISLFIYLFIQFLASFLYLNEKHRFYYISLSHTYFDENHPRACGIINTFIGGSFTIPSHGW